MIVGLAGGVGGARMAHGFAQVMKPEDLTIVVNVGDDFEHFGLKICPDLDTVCYTLAGLANPATGWGRSNESWQVLRVIEGLGGPTWFHLGDQDLGLHLERTRLLAEGHSLSQVTRQVCRSWGVQVNVLPATDTPIPTTVETTLGNLPFQEYFVRQACQPEVRAFHFDGVGQAQPAPGVLEAISLAEAVVIFPSNPWVSVDPILAIPGILEALLERSSLGTPIVAISPIIGGKTVKGPAAKMFAELGIVPSAFAVAEHYYKMLLSCLAGFVLDRIDAHHAPALAALGIKVLATDILMVDTQDRGRLAGEILQFISHIAQERSP
jgi:LPPG:FO 2-phospho-L-lactate transferase